MRETRCVNLQGVEFRFPVDDTGKEVLDEVCWRCPVTGNTLHIEKMDTNCYWMGFTLRRPDGETATLHLNFYAAPGAAVTLTVQDFDDLPAAECEQLTPRAAPAD